MNDKVKASVSNLRTMVENRKAVSGQDRQKDAEILDAIEALAVTLENHNIGTKTAAQERTIAKLRSPICRDLAHAGKIANFAAEALKLLGPV